MNLFVKVSLHLCTVLPISPFETGFEFLLISIKIKCKDDGAAEEQRVWGKGEMKDEMNTECAGNNTM